jgi:hypothetical protein
VERNAVSEKNKLKKNEKPKASPAGKKQLPGLHPKLSRVRFFADPRAPLDKDDWPEDLR